MALRITHLSAQQFTVARYHLAGYPGRAAIIQHIPNLPSVSRRDRDHNLLNAAGVCFQALNDSRSIPSGPEHRHAHQHGVALGKVVIQKTDHSTSEAWVGPN